MGLSSPDKLFYKSRVVQWEHIVCILHKTCTERGESNHIRKPTVDIDGNLLGYKLKDKAGGPIYEIMRCIDALLRSGFEVIVFVDGDKRHSTKGPLTLKHLRERSNG